MGVAVVTTPGALLGVCTLCNSGPPVPVTVPVVCRPGWAVGDWFEPIGGVRVTAPAVIKRLLSTFW